MKKTKFLCVFVRQEESAVERKIGLIFRVTSFLVVWYEVFSSWKKEKKKEIIFLNKDYFNFYVMRRNVGFLIFSLSLACGNGKPHKAKSSHCTNAPYHKITNLKKKIKLEHNFQSEIYHQGVFFARMAFY